MTFLTLIPALIAAVLAIACVMLWAQCGKMKFRAGMLEEKAGELDSLREKHQAYLEEKSVAVTRMQEMEKLLADANGAKQKAVQEKDIAQQAQREAEKQAALMRQSVAEMEQRRSQWEEQKQQFLKMTEASILEAGSKMSSKLLEDHKREAEAAKKESEAITKAATEKLFEQVNEITQKVASLKDQGAETKEKIGIVYRALSTPAGAGQLSEIGLENSLKNLGLDAQRDFVMQYAIPAGEGSSALRPDAVIFLPQDVVMVVDSKASKFTLEFAELEGSGREQEALDNLKRTMNTHLNALKSKDYASAIQGYYKAAGRSEKVNQILSVMFLPNEAAVERIKRADPEFLSKVEKAGLILAGPSSLAGLLTLATRSIVLSRQADNQEVIIQIMQDMMESIISVLSHTDKIGKGIASTAKYFVEFTGSINRNLLPKMRKLSSMGLKPAKNKEIPGRLGSYEVRALDEIVTLEGEAYEETAVVETLVQKKLVGV